MTTRDVFSLFKLAKAFDLVFQTAPFTVKPSVDVPSKMSHMEMIRSFHDNMVMELHNTKTYPPIFSN